MNGQEVHKPHFYSRFKALSHRSRLDLTVLYVKSEIATTAGDDCGLLKLGTLFLPSSAQIGSDVSRIGRRKAKPP